MIPGENLLRYILNPRLRIFWHILFWVFIYSDEFFSLIGITPPLENNITFFLNLGINALLVYFNIYILLPKLFNKGYTFLYILGTFACILTIMFSDWWMYYDPECLTYFSDSLANFVFNSLLISIPISIKLIKKAFVTQLHREKADSEKLNLELAYLKNQVNPHFLFNTLNSLYIQSKKPDSKVSESILSLSDILRYQLYDCQKERVSIKKEIEYLNNYLELEKNRRDQLEVKFNVDLHNQNIQIEPLLFLPLIENAVKYSQTENINTAYIHIQLKSDDGNITFSVVNNKGFKANEYSPQSGIGLSNLERRMELYYPNKHSILIENQENSFLVTLNIQTK